MSRSIHKTTRGVFFGVSKATLIEMTDPRAPDPDVEELLKKRRFKREERNRRAVKKAELDLANLESD